MPLGKAIDSLDGVKVYYNGSIGNMKGRNLAPDGYNMGMKYQCVEFVKRYYYQKYGHKMPDSYGNAVDFFDPLLPDGAMNKKRGLHQYRHPGKYKPKTGDLLIYDSTSFNKYGHVAIVSDVNVVTLEIIQQNPGPMAPSKQKFTLIKSKGNWVIGNDRILGWLRK